MKITGFSPLHYHYTTRSIVRTRDQDMVCSSIHEQVQRCTLVFAFLAVVFVQFALSSAPLSREQFYGLKYLYDSTGGNYWTFRPVESAGPKWDFSDPDADPCSTPSWQALSCNSIDGTPAITSLNMYMASATAADNFGIGAPGMNLTGVLPDDVFANLTNLVVLDMHANNLRLLTNSPTDSIKHAHIRRTRAHAYIHTYIHTYMHAYIVCSVNISQTL